MKMSRYWINAPSTSNIYNKEHGRKVLGPETFDQRFVTVYFASGPIISMMIDSLYLSRGWASGGF